MLRVILKDGQEICLIVEHQQLLYQGCVSKRTYEQEKEYPPPQKCGKKLVARH
jgi:hypothetical protein